MNKGKENGNIKRRLLLTFTIFKYKIMVVGLTDLLNKNDDVYNQQG
jgi:hypothetical protein